MSNLINKFQEETLRFYLKFGSLIFLPFAILFGANLSSAYTPAMSPIIPYNPSNLSDFGALINTIINFVTTFVGVVAILYLILAGFNYIMAGGNAKKAAAAKDGIINAILGIVIVIIAWILVQLVMNNLLQVKQSWIDPDATP